ncbi:MAG: signal peptidase II [Candidatus Buchananbacteria bacterium]|nr:signal peptidase II [Candidatus Buchananbacteria bacterium]
MSALRYWFINIIALNLLLLDISFKKIFSAFPSREYFIFGWLKLKLAVNPGIAFGLFLNYYLILFLYFVIIAILIYFLVYHYRRKNSLSVMGLAIIILGAFSNLLDRIFFGAVVDYIDLKYYTVFNLADVMIVLGIAILIVVIWKDKNKS